jgi:hypothetical protein
MSKGDKEMKRPIGVTILAIISGFMALLMALIALQWLGLLPWLGPGPAVRTFNIWYALLYGLLAYIYFWLTQMLWSMDQSAWLFLAVITVFNLILNFISLISGTPWEAVALPIILNTLVLIYIMLPGVRNSFHVQDIDQEQEQTELES